MQLCFLSYKHEETNDCVLRKESLKLPLHSRVWIEGGKNLNKIKICTFDCFVLLRLVCSNEWLPEWQQIAGRQFLLDSVECKNPSASQVFSGLSWTAPILIWRDLDWSCGHRGSEHRTTMDRRADAEMLIGWTINHKLMWPDGSLCKCELRFHDLRWGCRCEISPHVRAGLSSSNRRSEV